MYLLTYLLTYIITENEAACWSNTSNNARETINTQLHLCGQTTQKTISNWLRPVHILYYHQLRIPGVISLCCCTVLYYTRYLCSKQFNIIPVNTIMKVWVGKNLDLAVGWHTLYNIITFITHLWQVESTIITEHIDMCGAPLHSLSGINESHRVQRDFTNQSVVRYHHSHSTKQHLHTHTGICRHAWMNTYKCELKN